MNKHYSIGVDIGGTKIAIGWMDSDGRLIKRFQFPTEIEKSPYEIAKYISNTIRAEEMNFTQIQSVGVGIAGQVDKSGFISFAPNLYWKDVPLQKFLKEMLSLPVKVINDVRAATYGEWLYGAGKGSADLICLFVGTGIGSGIVQRRPIPDRCNRLFWRSRPHGDRLEWAIMYMRKPRLF